MFLLRKAASAASFRNDNLIWYERHAEAESIERSTRAVAVPAKLFVNRSVLASSMTGNFNNRRDPCTPCTLEVALVVK